MKLGIFTVLFDDRTLADAASYVSDLGYEMVELAVGTRHFERERAALEANYLGTLKRTVIAEGLAISALSDHVSAHMMLPPADGSLEPWPGTNDQEELWRQGKERLLATARWASELEVPVVCGFFGSTVWESWYMWPPTRLEIYARGWEIFVERWSPVLDEFAALGVRFAHEVHPGQIAYNTDTAEEATRRLDRDDWGFNFDPSHLVWQSIDPVVFIHTFGDRILHCHAKDVETRSQLVARDGVLSTGSWQRPGRAVRPRTPGWGDVDWRKVITALVEVGYDYVLSYEHEDPVMSEEDGAEQAISFLRPLLIKKPLSPESNARWLV
jgi:sugar phosphate isomerase/epimerase